MKQHKLMGAVAFSGVLALALAGCAADTGDNGGDGGNEPVETKAADYNPQDRENLQVGGEARFPINEIPEQLNSFHGDGSADTARVAAWYMPQILLQEADGTPYKHDAYLDEWNIETVDGNTQITFTFTDEAHWNDGTQMDWTAIDATWKANRSIDEGFVPNATDGYKQIASVEQGDTPKTAIVTFDGEFAWPQMPFLTGIIHPALADPTTFNEAMIGNLHPEWGAGPYTVDEFDANAGYVSYVPNPEWWGEEPLLEKVSFQAMDRSAAINAFKADEIDTVEVNTKDRLEQVKDMEDIEIYRATQTANTILEVDAEKPQFQDVKVREAFFKAVNVDQQKEIAWNGLGYEEEPAGSLTLFPFQPGYSNALAEAGWEYNPDEAKALLDEAGWTEGEDGIREKDGEKFSFTLHTQSQDWPLVIQQQWREAGIDAQVEYLDFPTLQSQFYTTEVFDAIAMWVPYSYYTDPHYALPGYFLSANNRNSYENPKSDELIMAAASTVDREERVRLYHEWQEVIAQDVPHLWIGNPDEVTAYSAGLVVPDLPTNYLRWRKVGDWFWSE